MLSVAEVLVTIKCKSDIKEDKTNYFSRLEKFLNDLAITPKKYSFLHKYKILKIPLIRHNNTFLNNILVKANTFNSFFAKQYSLIETSSELHADYLLTHHFLEPVNLDAAKFLSIICAFDVGKAYGWDSMKSVSMIHFIITVRIMIYFLRVNPVFVKVILACLSCCP